MAGKGLGAVPSFQKVPLRAVRLVGSLVAFSHCVFFPLHERYSTNHFFLSRCTSPCAQFLLRKNVMELWRDVHRTIRGVDDKDYVDFLTIQVCFSSSPSSQTGCCRAAARFLLRIMNPWQDIVIHRAFLRFRTLPATRTHFFLLLHYLILTVCLCLWFFPPTP